MKIKKIKDLADAGELAIKIKDGYMLMVPLSKRKGDLLFLANLGEGDWFFSVSRTIPHQTFQEAGYISMHGVDMFYVSGIIWQFHNLINRAIKHKYGIKHRKLTSDDYDAIAEHAMM